MSRSPTGAGAPFALLVFVGAGIGVATGQVGAGIVGGTTAGAALATWLWWCDRRPGD